jgi:hypothetical protein
VTRLWRDLAVALDGSLSIVHLPPEPVSVADVARVAFGIEFTNEVSIAPARYDVRTRHAELFGGSGDYVESRSRALANITAFVQSERRVR